MRSIARLFMTSAKCVHFLNLVQFIPLAQFA